MPRPLKTPDEMVPFRTLSQILAAKPIVTEVSKVTAIQAVQAVQAALVLGMLTVIAALRGSLVIADTRINEAISISALAGITGIV
jgi:hypothetical protein